jgi:protein phosphatase
MNKLYVTIGTSGSGKSTYLNKHFDKKYIVNVDDIRKELTGDVSNQSINVKAWQVAVERTKNNLKKYGKSVLDATNTHSGYRSDFLKNFDDVEKIAIVFETEPEIAKSRVNKDIISGKDRANVPPEVIYRQYAEFISGRENIKKQFDRVINANRQMEILRNFIRNEIKAHLYKNNLR